MKENIEPINRNESLKNLSRDHHFGLLFCWKLRSGLKKSDPARIKKYADHFYQKHLKEHFKVEEKYIFPLLGEESMVVETALGDHKKLRGLFESRESSVELLGELEKTLERHIRFEERVLFKELQLKIPEERLIVSMRYHSEKPEDDQWEDRFWE